MYEPHLDIAVKALAEANKQIFEDSELSIIEKEYAKCMIVQAEWAIKMAQKKLRKRPQQN